MVLNLQHKKKASFICSELEIHHKLIKERTPMHNGKNEKVAKMINKVFAPIYLSIHMMIC